MAKISYQDFRQKLRREIWPSTPGEAANLVDQHNTWFLEAMANAGKWVKCLQDNHTDVHPFCSTFVECGKTVVPAPIGHMRRVYTIANGEWCDPDTRVPHLANLMACCAIILDANAVGKLVDDRPPRGDEAAVIDSMVELVDHMKQLFEGHDPHQYTIEDSEWVPESQVTNTTSDTTPAPKQSANVLCETKLAEMLKKKGG